MLHLHIRRAVVGLGSAAVIAALAVAPAGAATPATPAKPAPAPTAKAAPTVQGPSAISRTPAAPRASQDGACDVGDVCLYYYSNFAGSRYDTAHNDPYLFNNRFNTAGIGQWARVANNSESVWNRDPNTGVNVCTGVNYTGCGYVGPNSFGNFGPAFKNNVESIIWADSSN